MTLDVYAFAVKGAGAAAAATFADAIDRAT
jgi:hypothetical protein